MAGHTDPETAALAAGLRAAGAASEVALARVIAGFHQLDILPTSGGGVVALALARPSDYAAGLARHAAVTAAGVGARPAEALVRCAGEAAEYLSQLLHGDEELVAQDGAAPVAAMAAPFAAYLDHRRATGGPLAWTPAVRMHDGAAVQVPAWLAYRLPADSEPPFPLSIGCAAGPTFDDAVLAALLEVVERDAVALWWQGGLPAIRDDGGDGTPASPWFLRLPGEHAFGVAAPVSVALAAGVLGAGFVCGAAAAASEAQARKAAKRELAMMDLAQRLALFKAGQGRQLAPEEARHAARAARRSPVDARRLVDAAGDPVAATGALEGKSGAAVRAIVGRLSRMNIECFLVDTTRPWLEIPSARVLIPALQPYPARLSTARATAAAARYGGGPGRGLAIDAL